VTLGPAISEILPLAVGVMISPIPIIAVILMLLSPRARANGPSFLIGWIVGLSIVSAVVYFIADSADVATDSSASDTTSTTKVVLGVVLMFLALRQWRGRPAPGEPTPPPKWMAAIDSVTPVKAVGLGVLLSAINPKNLILTVGAAAAIAQTGPSTGDAVVAIIVFVLIASLSIIVPVAAYLLAGERARTMLDGWKAWLEQHNAAVMTVVLLVIGVVLLGKGLGLLTA
jgi:threonine/homoserine/homoserine lactone efflux protein